MERGLLWLPLLVAFFWLAWAGWNEYQKIEAYKRWATQFDSAKYDIYAVLGYKDGKITWGKPTRKDPLNLQTISLHNVDAISLLVDDKTIELDNLPNKGSATLEFSLSNANSKIRIPFTDISLAAKWANFLQEKREVLSVNSQ